MQLFSYSFCFQFHLGGFKCVFLRTLSAIEIEKKNSSLDSIFLSTDRNDYFWQNRKYFMLYFFRRIFEDIIQPAQLLNSSWKVLFHKCLRTQHWRLVIFVSQIDYIHLDEIIGNKQVGFHILSYYPSKHKQFIVTINF